MPITTTPATVEDFPIRRRTIGIIESLATVVVKSRIESQVTEQHVKDGQLVKKGDPLFTLDDREVKATIARDEAPQTKVLFISNDPVAAGLVADEGAPEGNLTNAGDPSQPSVFTAIEEQLGLKLESMKVPVEMLVIDRCERVPAQN